MSLYQMNKLLRDVNCSSALAQRCQAEPDAVLHQYDLTPEERDALKGWQVRKLYDMGANGSVAKLTITVCFLQLVVFLSL